TAERAVPTRGTSVDREGWDEEGSQSLSSRRVLRRKRVGANGTCRRGRPVAAGSGRNRGSVLSIVRTRSHFGSDPPASALPGVSRRHGETVVVSPEGTVRWQITCA